MKASEQKTNNFDYDYIIIGSGFGDSVSALQLTEKAITFSARKGKKAGIRRFPSKKLELGKMALAATVQILRVSQNYLISSCHYPLKRRFRGWIACIC